jgi:hypothetical protein
VGKEHARSRAVASIRTGEILLGSSQQRIESFIGRGSVVVLREAPLTTHLKIHTTMVSQPPFDHFR